MTIESALAWGLAQPEDSRALALADAYASGALRVTFEGRTVEYRSLDDLSRALVALWRASIAIPGGVAPGGITVSRGAGW